MIFAAVRVKSPAGRFAWFRIIMGWSLSWEMIPSGNIIQNQF